ncbi:FMN-dependent NADH-azoreductase [Terriglobus aquaticus]|uniref:FMN dependent NADH:quinone oxidoreductase n=1 Tax=Terriglobus aquaticus TaxID=940139 RepID=A0ABW9KNQ7_9BACT|nr:NAD(P)H-dependent oxidoreductase [Terriglobus aquaticus]
MASLLRIDVSPRGNASYSRRLGDTFTEAWKSAHSGGSVAERDLAVNQPTYVDIQWIQGAFSAPDQQTDAHKAALKLSDEYIAEVKAADHILITTPMYNFTVPAVLKAWIDHVVRVGVTVNYTDKGPVGQLNGKKVTVIVASAGAYVKGTPTENFNYLNPYLQHILGFIGITDVTFVNAEGGAGVQYGKISEADYLKPSEDKIAELAKA